MSRSPLSTLRARAVILVLLVAAPIWVVVWWSALEFRAAMAADVQQHAVHLVRLVASEQERHIRDVHLLLTTLSRLPEVRDQDPAACSALFGSLVGQFPQYANLGVMSSEGAIYCSGHPIAGSGAEKARAMQPLLAAVRAQPQFVIGDYQVSPTTGNPVIAFAYPVRRNAAEVASVLFATLNLNWLGDVPLNALLPQGTTLRVMDAEGTLLVRYPEVAPLHGERIPNEPLFQAILASGGEGTVLMEGLDDILRLYAFTRLPGQPGSEVGYVSIGLPPELAFADVDRIFQRNLILLTLLIALGIGVAWVGSRRLISAPVNRLLTATNRLATGDLEARAGPLPGGGELDELGRAVDEMAAALKGRQLASRKEIVEREAIEEALRFRLWQQAMVARLGQQALAGADLTALLEEAVLTLAGTLDVEFTKVIELQPEAGTLLLRAGVGWREGVVGTTEPVGEGFSQASYTLARGEPVIVEDLRSEHRFAPPPLLLEHGARSGISVTIRGRERPFGVLCAHTVAHRLFTLDDVNFLQAVANVLATAVERERADEALLDSERQFRQAQKTEAIGRLAGGVAHDFNNLLTVIRGNIELTLQELSAAHPLREPLEEIGAAAARAATLTQQLLAYSRQQVMQPRVLDLNATLSGLEEMLRRAIGEDIVLRIQRDPRLGLIRADPGQIEQVLLNLVVNARDAMPRGGTLAIETENAEVDGSTTQEYPEEVAPGAYVQLRVTDTGTGMDEATLSRLFEPFFTTKEVGKGTGLGLPTVYGIVRQNGGHVWAESAPGKGSSFTILLPRIEQPAEEMKPASGGVKTTAGSGTVLLVEDEDAVRRLARRILERSGYVVLEAADPRDALRICSEYEGSLELMLTDVVMPGMSGPELAEQLRDVRPTMQVLYMSGYTDDALAQHGMLADDVHFLEKPFSPDLLLERVREVLHNGSRA